MYDFQGRTEYEGMHKKHKKGVIAHCVGTVNIDDLMPFNLP